MCFFGYEESPLWISLFLVLCQLSHAKKKKTSDKKTYPLDLLLPSASQSAVKLFTLPLHIPSCYFQPFGELNA
jgi:hypothetical protein